MNFNWANELAKNALKTAQKRIDSVLDIAPEDEVSYFFRGFSIRTVILYIINYLFIHWLPSVKKKYQKYNSNTFP